MLAGGVTKARIATAIALALVVAAIVFVVMSLTGHVGSAAFIDSRPPPDLAERFYPPENWAWGELQHDGGTAQRYGVSAPAVAPRADILILPDYGESAETWFETAHDLNGAGFDVWVLEGVGQGGSARIGGPRDLGELKRFDGDLAGVRGMIDTVIRPTKDRPLVIVGQGVGALLAARVVEIGPVTAGLVLSAPRCAPATPAGALVYLGLGAFRAPGGDTWNRTGPDDLAAQRTHDRWRGAVTHAWQSANPDLRLGGPSLDWQAAVGRLQHDAEAGATHLSGPVLLIDNGGPSACLASPAAVRRSLAGAGPALELEDDRWRAPWLAAIEAFAQARATLPAHGP
jgi:lysophospholipase